MESAIDASNESSPAGLFREKVVPRLYAFLFRSGAVDFLAVLMPALGPRYIVRADQLLSEHYLSVSSQMYHRTSTTCEAANDKCV